MKNRENGVDFVKGMLVIGMILYHTSGIFPGDDPETAREIRAHLSFISGSWIFISGIIISAYYRKAFEKSWLQPSKRLWTRGLKLLGVFLFINISINTLGLSSYHGPQDLAYFKEVFAGGPGKLVAFEILVGISYVMLLAPFILFLGDIGIAIIIIAIGAVHILSSSGYAFTSNTWFVLWGAGGIVAGRFIRASWKELVYGPLNRFLFSFLISAGAVIVYYLSEYLGFDIKSHLLIYLFGITAILSLLYICHRIVRHVRTLDSIVRLLGRYPLISYIWQMALIQTFAFYARRWDVELGYGINVLVITVTLILSIALLDYLIRKYQFAKSSYRLVFG